MCSYLLSVGSCFYNYLVFLTLPLLSPCDSSASDPLSSSSTVTSAPMTEVPTFSKPRFMTPAPSCPAVEPESPVVDSGTLPMVEP